LTSTPETLSSLALPAATTDTTNVGSTCALAEVPPLCCGPEPDTSSETKLESSCSLGTSSAAVRSSSTKSSCSSATERLPELAEETAAIAPSATASPATTVPLTPALRLASAASRSRIRSTSLRVKSRK
tara:strand:- start:786 stop:1172 length:387 start_codon:yes stop_codon:yes gene_type:complete